MYGRALELPAWQRLLIVVIGFVVVIAVILVIQSLT
jgi:hypothetical protein